MEESEENSFEKGEKIDIRDYLCSRKFLILSGLIKLLSSVALASPVLIFFHLLNELKKDQRNIGKCYLLFASIILCNFCKLVLENLYFHLCVKTASRARVLLMNLIYKKVMKMSLATKLLFTTGDVVTLMGLHVQCVEEFMVDLHVLWDSWFQIGVYVALVLYLAKVSGLLGLCYMLAVLFFQSYIMVTSQKNYKRSKLFMNKRVELLTDIFGGIKMIKMYAYEIIWGKEVEKIRKKELAVMRKAYLLDGFIHAIMQSTPNMCLMFVFTIMIYKFGIKLDAQFIFPLQMSFSKLRGPLISFPMALQSLIQYRQGVSRLNTFLNASEVKKELKHVDSTAVACQLKDCTLVYRDQNEVLTKEGFVTKLDVNFSRDFQKLKEDSARPILRDVNLEIPKKKLTIIHGPVGTGKSSLLHAILGEMHVSSSGAIYIDKNLKIAYAPQTPWIFNSTLKDNVLFGYEFDRARYEYVLKICQLEEDLKKLQFGDLTELGEKGLNLSGGQKQRVSLARAVYADADFILLDDPLSALDAEVGKAVMEKCVLDGLRDKTVILVTNQKSWLERADYIIEILDDGTCKGYKNECPPRLGISDKTGILSYAISTDTTKRMQTHMNRDQGGTLTVDEATEDKETSFEAYRSYFNLAGHPLLVLFCVLVYAAPVFFNTSIQFVLLEWSKTGDMKFYFINWVMVICVFLTGYCGAALMYIICLNASRKLHSKMYNSLSSATLSWLQSVPTGRIINRFSTDVSQMDLWFSTFLTNMLRTLFILISIFVSTAINLYWASLSFPFLIFFCYFVMKFFSKTIKELKKLDAILNSPVFSHLTQTLNGLLLIRAFGRTNEFIIEHALLVSKFANSNYTRRLLNGWLAVRLEVLGLLIHVAVGIIAIHVGGNLAIALLNVQALGYFLPLLIKALSDVDATMSHYERVLEYSRENQMEKKGVEYETSFRLENHDRDNWPASGRIVLKNLRVRYKTNSQYSLKGVSLEIKHGERVGVCGRTGSGKSTLLLSLLRLIEPEGTDEKESCGIEIDGVDIAHIPLKRLRSAISIVPQDPILWTGTLRMNLDPYDIYQDEEIWQALQKVNLRGFLENRFSGLTLSEINVSENGENFSLGQKQLFCLCRAILKKSKIILLDEATSALDSETDNLIQKILREIENCTVVTIAHRIGTILDYDKILVLSDGQIAEFDKPSNLIERGGHLKNLMKEYNEEF